MFNFKRVACLLLLAITTVANAADLPKVHVRGRDFAYSFERKSDSFVYQQSGPERALKVAKCNESKFSDFVSDFKRLNEKTSSLPLKLRNPSTLIVRIGDDERFVSPGSELGQWLRAVPARMMTLSVEAEYACAQH